MRRSKSGASKLSKLIRFHFLPTPFGTFFVLELSLKNTLAAFYFRKAVCFILLFVDHQHK
jgi:hypothetical protein